jgi:hypothetical protein
MSAFQIQYSFYWISTPNLVTVAFMCRTTVVICFGWCQPFKISMILLNFPYFFKFCYFGNVVNFYVLHNVSVHNRYTYFKSYNTHTHTLALFVIVEISREKITCWKYIVLKISIYSFSFGGVGGGGGRLWFEIMMNLKYHISQLLISFSISFDTI